MALFPGFFRRKAPQDTAVRERVRGWCLEALGSEADLTLSEVDCPDPACPGLETFILVLRPGEATQAAKIRKPLADITPEDVQEALRFL